MRTVYGKGQYAPSVATDQHQVVLPRLYKADGTKRAVLYAHRQGADALEFMQASAPIAQAIINLGLPIISFDAQGNNWGNDNGQLRMTDALSYLRTAYGASATLDPILIGTSMGGPLSLNWARSHSVQALLLFYPAVDLQWEHDNGQQATTEAAYGGSLSTFNAAVAAHDPMQHTAAYATLPVKMWYSTTDTVVSTDRQLAFAAAVGSNVLTSSLGPATHVDMSVISPTEVASFVATYA